IRDADYLIQSFLPMPEPQPAPPPYQPSGLPMPFCLPQIAASFDSSFARGYSPELQTSAGITQEQLLTFIDGLNLAMTSSPPLRVVNIAGAVIGFIPYHWAKIAGAVVQTAAQTGMHILSKTLTDRYLRAANLRLFKPKGLSVRLCTTAAMQHLVMRKGSGAGLSTLDKIGRGIGTVLLYAPIPFSSRIVRSIAEKPPKVHASISEVGDGKKLPLATQRRLATLHGYALPLQLDVPPPAKTQGVMDSMASWGVSSDARRTGRKENKNYAMGRRERKELRKAARREQRELRKAARREHKELRKAARRSRKQEHGGGLISELIGPKEGKLERRVANADLLEHWASDKALWVVIMNAEMDKEIEGIEGAESLNNEEHVNQQTWQSEIVKERDALEEE
ncbi:hypothetical protein B0H17DRAFT_870002, partial [Mycena rosella]